MVGWIVGNSRVKLDSLLGSMVLSPRLAAERFSKADCKILWSCLQISQKYLYWSNALRFSVREYCNTRYWYFCIIHNSPNIYVSNYHLIDLFCHITLFHRFIIRLETYYINKYALCLFFSELFYLFLCSHININTEVLNVKPS